MVDEPTIQVRFGERDGDRLVISVTGDLDYGSAKTFPDTVDALRIDGDRHLVLDFSGVGFCDSAGLTSLVAMARQARELGGRLLLAAPRSNLTRTLTMTGLDVLISTYPSIADALAALPPDRI